MATDDKDIARIEAVLASVGLKLDDVLAVVHRFEGKIEPLVEEVPKLRDKVQVLEVSCATLTVDLTALKAEVQRLKAVLATLATSGAVAGGAFLLDKMSQ